MRAAWAVRIAFAAFAAGVVLVPSTAALAKSSVPYSDSRSTGSIVLCNAAGQNITHGSVYDKPFAYRVVSSVPVPAQYRIAGRRATLYAFQPRQGVDPGSWSGDSLTATSTYTNPLVPMAEGSRRDIALSDYLDEYPSAWKGLVQLRLFASAPNAGVDNTSYPTANIEVTGTTWKLLDPVALSCTDGAATTPEDQLASSNPIGLGSPEPLYNLTPGVVVLGTPSAAAVSDAGSGGGRSGLSTIGLSVASAAGVVVVGGGALWWRRRSQVSR